MKLSAAKKSLLARRAELIGDIADKEDQIEENSTDDQEDKMAERQEDEILSALSQSDHAEIIRIDAALKRLDEGTYGICANCGEEIAPARLEAMPDTVLCVSCASE